MLVTRDDVVFTEHAVDRMAERGIVVRNVLETLTSGEVIESNPKDTPYPSTLSFAMVADGPLHVLWAVHPETRKIIVITTDVPDVRWNPDFRTRKEQS
jgi:hypothetical protein